MNYTEEKKYMNVFSQFIIILFIILTISGCYKVEDDLQKALEYAGSNKTELYKVLRYYKNSDSEKYDAACFLIKNMPYYGSYDGEALQDYLRYFEMYATTSMSPQQVIDSLEKVGSVFNIRKLDYKRDILTIDSAFLVNHIDWAFKVWREQPWGRNVTFNNFCEYILPYRVGDEPLSLWREDLYNKYNPLLDSLRNQSMADDPLDAAQVLIDYFNKKQYRFTGLFPSGPNLGPIVLEWKTGSCREFADMIVYALRAVGIPCGIDRVLQRPDDNASHFWNFTLNKEGSTYMTEFPYQNRWREAYKYSAPKGKIYRVSFGLNVEKMRELEDVNNVYPAFKFPFIHEVTSLYAKTHIVSIPRTCINANMGNEGLVYLCFANHQQWLPVDYAFLKNDTVKFYGIEGGIVGVIAKWNGKCFKPLTTPFLVEKATGQLRFFIPKNEMHTVNLYCKFYLAVQDYIYSRMCGGVIEGSNTPDFHTPDTLYQVQETPKRLYSVAHLKSKKAYRYMRYKGGKGSFCNIAELVFYKGMADTIPLTGKVIGTPGCFSNDDKHEYTNVFDGDPNTSFDYKYPDSGWVGLDFGRPYIVEKAVYTPRNHINFIYKNDEYELFYWDKGEWISVGKQLAVADSLTYSVPRNALLYLKYHSHGKDERIFEYKDGQQIFW